MSTPDAYFEQLYQSDDPFGYRARWFEQRKRQLLLAALPYPRFNSVWELGCSNGELSAGLADRCQALLATDLSARAVELARARIGDRAHVKVQQARHPDDWPADKFDLIVFSEVGYYLDAAAMATSARMLASSLTAGGVLIACHWRQAFAEAPLHGDQVHAKIDENAGLAHVFGYLDEDFRLDAWSNQATSVAQRYGVR